VRGSCPELAEGQASVDCHIKCRVRVHSGRIVCSVGVRYPVWCCHIEHRILEILQCTAVGALLFIFCISLKLMKNVIFCVVYLGDRL
jgi:hypothetical protein